MALAQARGEPGCSLSRLSPGAEGPASELPHARAVAGEFNSSPAVGWRPQLHDVEIIHDVELFL